MIQWHRLLGIALTHHFEGFPVLVETEKDLSLKQQYLDIILAYLEKLEKGED